MFIKKFLAVMSACMIICSLNLCEAAKKVVAVMPLENVSGCSEEKVAEIMTEQLITVIHSSGNYTVVEREQIGAVLKEQGFQNIAVDPNKAVEWGKLSGADYTLIGKITLADNKKNELSETFSAIRQIVELERILGGNDSELSKIQVEQPEFKICMELRFIDNTTGEVAVATSVEGVGRGETNLAATNVACKAAAENFLRELQKINPFAARIADIFGVDIYIDKGSDSGLRKGEFLVISREIAPIVVSGKIVGMKSVKIGRAQVIEVNAEYSVCRLVEQFYIVKQGDVLKREEI